MCVCDVDLCSSSASSLRCLKRHRKLCYVFALAMEGLCCFFIPLLRTFALLVPFSVLYGYFDGAYVALIPVVTSDVVGTTYLSSALGVVYFLHAIPYLLSPPIGGWLVDTTGSYTATFFLSGFSLISSSLLVCTATIVRHCHRRHYRNTHGTQTPPTVDPCCESKQADFYITKNKDLMISNMAATTS